MRQTEHIQCEEQKEERLMSETRSIYFHQKNKIFFSFFEYMDEEKIMSKRVKRIFPKRFMRAVSPNTQNRWKKGSEQKKLESRTKYNHK